MITRRSAIGAAAAAPLLTPALARAAAAAPTIEALTRRPAVIGASLSPDGEKLAVLRQQPGPKRFAWVDVLPAADLKAKPVQIPLDEVDAYRVDWGSNERVLVGVQQFAPESDVPGGTPQAPLRVRRLISVGADGSGMAMLLQDGRIGRANPDLARFTGRSPQDSQHIFMQAVDPSLRAEGTRSLEQRAQRVALFKVNLATGAHEQVEKGDLGTGWFIQGGWPVLRVDRLTLDDITISGRPVGAKDWKLLRKAPPVAEFSQVRFLPSGATDDPRFAVVLQRGGSGSPLAVKRFDLATGEVGEPVSSHPELDVDDVLLDGLGRYVAAVYAGDRWTYDFADPQLAPHYRAVDRFLKGEASARLVDTDRAHRRFVVDANGPRVAGAFYLYDRETRRMDAIGLSRPWLPLDSLAPVESLDVKTRDDAVIRAYLTVPLASGPRPLVVLPHDGPERRDMIDFDVWAQALAAQGWLVLQPNYRGSGGYGPAFLEAGRGRWHTRIQEDVEDAVAQVLASGRADPSKVAICGQGFGGYCALLGAARKPDLYRAVVAVNGLADPADLLTYAMRGGPSSPIYRYLERGMGPAKSDPAGSPRRRAGEIKAPVLLIAGEVDRTIPPRQSRGMADALKGAGKPVELVELKDVGHTDWEPEVLRSVLDQTVAFIGKAFA